MSRTPTKTLAEIGVCIYCGTSMKRLSKEHIVPHGLDGPWVLQKASCDDCAKITSAFEMTVLRGIFPLPRAALNLPSYNKKNRSRLYPINVVRNNRTEIIEVPIQDHFPLAILPTYLLPAYLDHRPYNQGIEVLEPAAFKIGGSSLKTISEKYGKDTSIKIETFWHGNHFEQLLAKIAYGFAIAEFGLSKLKEIYVLDCILGRKDDAGKWIGCIPDYWSMPAPVRVYVSSNQGIPMHVISIYIDKNGEILVSVKLFAAWGTPNYCIIVGRK